MMAIERKRGCGFRKVGKTYLVGEGIFTACDRLPYPVGSCPVCGAGIPLTRGTIKINPLKLFGYHQPCSDKWPDIMCTPRDEIAYIMTVGIKYYPMPQDFAREAMEMGVSKAIPTIPKKLELGRTVIFLCHPKAIAVTEPIAVQQAMAVVEQAGNPQQSLFPLELANKPTYKPGIFMTFVPRRVEKLCWQSDYTEENMEKHKKRGIDLVPVPDGDKDHG
jgi:hypothetical protein